MAVSPPPPPQMLARKVSAAGRLRYGAGSMVPTNSKRVVKAGLLDFGRGLMVWWWDAPVGCGTKPCDVGMLDRMSGWLRFGTWNTALGRGVNSHLVVVSK